LILLKFTIKEDDSYENASEEKVSIIRSFKNIAKDENKKSLYLLFSIFFWFVGYQGVLATFSNYAVHHLNVSAKEGSFIILFFAAFFLLSAIPAGMIGEKLGKKKTIVIGLTILIFSYLILSLVKIEYSIGPLHYNHIMMILFAIGGLGWALVNINSYPYIVEGIDEGLYGTYTGMYYFFSSLAAILGPLVMGIFIDIIGFGSMFPVAVIAFVFAYFMMKKKY
jgi:MFS family permease